MHSLAYKAMCSWNFVHCHFLMQKPQCDYLIIFWDLLTFFFATFFQKQALKDHLTHENLLKPVLLNEK